MGINMSIDDAETYTYESAKFSQPRLVATLDRC